MSHELLNKMHVITHNGNLFMYNTPISPASLAIGAESSDRPILLTLLPTQLCIVVSQDPRLSSHERDVNPPRTKALAQAYKTSA
jgi:hypothetical protein